jgi:hypothetical protein
MKVKQKAYEAKQKILAEQAEQARIQKENERWEEERLAEQARVNAILQKESYRKEQEYLKEKARQNAITRRRIEEWESAEEDRLAKFELSKKIIAEGHIRESERYIAKSKQKSKSKKKKSIHEGMPMNAASTWQLTWKSFSTHPKIIDLPMSEKVRLYKLAERQQADKLNYYATMGSVAGSGIDWEDGTVDHDNVVHVNTTVENDLVVNATLIIQPDVTFIVNGTLTVEKSIINNGRIIVNGLLIKAENIITNEGGSLTIN